MAKNGLAKIGLAKVGLNRNIIETPTKQPTNESFRVCNVNLATLKIAIYGYHQNVQLIVAFRDDIIFDTFCLLFTKVLLWENDRRVDRNYNLIFFDIQANIFGSGSEN